MEVLVIDDDTVYREAVLLFLEGAAVCHCIEEGIVGLSLFERQVAVGRPFAAVVVDNEMPGLKGVEVIRGIRALEARWGLAETPIVIVSSSSLEAEEAEVLNDPRVRFLPKPFGQAALLETVGQLGVSFNSGDTAINSLRTGGRPPPLRFLA